MPALIIVCLYLWILLCGTSAADNRRSQCERITIPMCQDMPYNLTRLPNLLGHMDQATAAIQVHEFIPLVEIGCSKHLKFFLCSLYAPMCTEQVDVPIPSCQSICEDVKSKCLPVLQHFHFHWPDMLNCSRLPVPEKNGLCMEFPNITDENRRKESAATESPYGGPITPFNLPGRSDPPTWPRTRTTVDSLFTKPCPERYVRSEDLTAKCYPRCGWDVLYTRYDKDFAEVWMGVWASVCFMATLVTACTFWLDYDRFHYPERPIVFISICFCLLSVAYLFRMFLGSEFVSCDKEGEYGTHLVAQDLENIGCTFVFVLLYYFSLSAHVWWVVLTITWYLAASKKWSQEAIKAIASYFHLAAWGIPALLTIVVLTLRYVEGDELFGLCFVGNESGTAVLGFLLLPLFGLFAVGVVFIGSGFVALFHIRRLMKHSGRNVYKLEKLMVRIGMFSILYTVPCLCLIGCYFYEYRSRDKWKTAAYVSAVECQVRGEKQCKLQQSIPNTAIFIVKHFMLLLLGVTTGVWVWSNKTWNAWSKFVRSCCFRKKRRDFKTLPQPPVTWTMPPNKMDITRV